MPNFCLGATAPRCWRAPTHEMTAKVGMSLGGLRQSFTTANRHEPDRAVHMQLIEGPFSHLQGAGNLRRWARLTMRGGTCLQGHV